MKIRIAGILSIVGLVVIASLTASAQAQTGFTVAANITAEQGNIATYGSPQEFRMTVTSNNMRVYFPQQSILRQAVGVFTQGQEYHVTATYDGSELVMYVDGAGVETYPLTGMPIIPDAYPASVPSTEFTYLPYAADASEIAALADAPPPPPQCMTIIGFSQVRSQYSEPAFDKTGVQLLIRTGIGDVDHWQDPNFDGWSMPFDFPVPGCGFENTGSIVYVVTGTPRPNWTPDIQAAVDTIWTKFPNAHTLTLQAVTGGPDHVTCYLPDSTPVRASVNNPVIDIGIKEVADANPNVFAGASPEVADCGMFADSRGHMTQAGNEYMAPLLDWVHVR